MAKRRFGEFLIQKNVLNQQQLAAILKLKQGSSQRLGQLLVEQKILSEDQLTALLGEFFGLPVFTAEQVELSQQVLNAVPQAVAVKYQIVPVADKNNSLYLGSADRLSQAVLENLRRVTGRRITPVLMSRSELLAVLQQAYPDAFASASSSFTDQPSELAETAGETTDIIELLDDILIEAYKQNASDIHLEPEVEHMRVRFRVDGELATVRQIPYDAGVLLISRLKVLSRMNIAERRSPQDGGFLFQPQERNQEISVNIRVSVLPCVRGEKTVLRLLSAKEEMMDLENIGLEKSMLVRLRQLLAMPHGMIFVTGPTGSGKTRTLYSMLKHLRADNINITTVEDPVEVKMKGITQTQVGAKVSFSKVLSSILRQDPDVIMVGEVRDSETAQLALQAALTGHLVLSTLHTSDAAGAFARLFDMGCEPFLVSASVRGVLAQRLVRLICPHCRQPYTPTAAELRALGIPVVSRETFYAGKGCAACRGTGYAGRTGLFELLIVDGEMQKLISQRQDTHVITEYAVSQGMTTMRQDGILKVRQGLTTAVEVLKTTASSKIENLPAADLTVLAKS
ncbi:GspE/PulE family protein [Peptococcaceae bacterium]|nr:GspE/PulE family protein [Peptococcaceae bacterium]